MGRPAGRWQQRWIRRARNGWILLLALAIFFYAPILAGLRTFPDGDFTHHFLPFNLFLRQELAAGRLPLWNPFTYSGHPFLADIQAAVFYPLGTLWVALTLPLADAGTRLYLLQLEAVMQVALAGCFTYLLVRRLTGRHTAGLVAGICFAFSGYLTGYPVVQLAVLRTAIWLPLLLWLLLRGAAAPRRWERWLAVAPVAAVAFLGGHAQTFLYSAYTAAAWAALLAVWQWRRQPWEGAALVGGLLAAAALAGGLAAPQLLPSLEYVQQSVRANVDYAYVSGGFPLQDTWQLLLPGVLTEYSPLYIGAVGLGLSFVAAGAAALRKDWSTVEGSTPEPGKLHHRTGVCFFGGLALVALLLSYGGNGPLYPLFYQSVPGFDLFRGQERAAFLVAFGLSVLAGYGMLAVRLLPPTLRSWLATLYAGLATAAVYLFGLLWQLPGQSAVGQLQFLGGAALTLATVAGLALLLRLPGWTPPRTQLLVLLTFASLFWAHAGTQWSPFGPARKTLLAPEVMAIQQAVSSPEAGTPGRVYNEYRVYEDYGMRAGVEDVWGASPLRLARYALLFDKFPLDRLWRLTGVSHVLTWRRDLVVPATLLAEFPQQNDTTYLHRLEKAPPRAWVVHDVVVADDSGAAVLLADHSFDLDRRGILPTDPKGLLAETSLAAQVQPAQVQLVQKAPGVVTVQVASPTPGLLIVSENWLPGWRVVATRWPVDAPPPLDEPLRANLTLLGLPVPAGEVEVELRYRPDSVRFGLAVGAASAGVLLVAAVVAGLQRRRRGA